ncbi:hypothetical protein D3C72_2161080 [compost metagenome]
MPIRTPLASYDGTAGMARWSKKPSFSSKVTKRAVLLQTSGLDVSASNTSEMKSAAPATPSLLPGCSARSCVGNTQDTCGRVPLATSCLSWARKLTAPSVFSGPPVRPCS